MNNYKKGGFRQGGGSRDGGRPKFGNKFGGGRDGGSRDGERKEFFPAICSDCRKNCDVPFRPTGDKPVYCRDCFGKQRTAPGQNFGGNDRSGGDMRREAPRPQFERPGERAAVAAQPNAELEVIKRQLSALEIKVNRILELISQKSEAPAAKAPVAAESTKAVVKEEKVKSAAKKAVKSPAPKTAKKAKK